MEGRDVLGHPLGLHSVGAPCTPISDPALSVGCPPAQLRGVKSRRLWRRTGEKGNGLVLAFTDMLWVFCLCLSRSARFKERAAGIPEEPASPTQLWSPHGRRCLPCTPTQGLSRPLGLSRPRPHRLSPQEYPRASSLPTSIRADTHHATPLLSASPLQSQP